MRILKYPLGREPIWMPRGAKALYVGEKDNDIFIWMLCDQSQPGEERAFLVLATNESFTPDLIKYIGTIQQSNGLVWHIWE